MSFHGPTKRKTAVQYVQYQLDGEKQRLQDLTDRQRDILLRDRAIRHQLWYLLYNVHHPTLPQVIVRQDQLRHLEFEYNLVTRLIDDTLYQKQVYQRRLALMQRHG